MTVAHIVFLLGLVGLIVAMALRKNVLIPAVAATFATALAYDGNVASAVMAVFRATLTAGGALFEIFVAVLQAYVFTMLSALFIGMGKRERARRVRSSTAVKEVFVVRSP